MAVFDCTTFLLWIHTIVLKFTMLIDGVLCVISSGMPRMAK